MDKILNMTTLSFLIIVISSLIIAWLINYLADVLPLTRRLSQPLCLNCGEKVAWKDYLLFKKCIVCSKSPRHRILVVNILVPLGILMLWLYPNSVGSSPAITTTPIFDVLLKGLIFSYFVLVAVIDLEYRAVLFPVVFTGIVLGAVFGFIYHGWLATLLGFVTGFGIMLLLYYLGKLFVKLLNRKRTEQISEDALGFGDVNLSGVLGLILGYPGIIAGLILGIVFGGFGSLAYLGFSQFAGKYKVFTPLPYAPFLVAGAAFLLFVV